MGLLVWGGNSGTNLKDGGLYCACGPDSDFDGAGDACDTCPTVYNPTQDPNACVQSASVSISFNNPIGKGSGTVRWNTTREVDLTGFNLVILNSAGDRIQLNLATIPCKQCTTGLGDDYTFIVAKHKSGKDLFVEMLHNDGQVTLFGPALKP